MGLKSSLLLLMLCVASTGCMRERTKIVYASFHDPGIEAVRIATNKKIPVTIGEEYTEQAFPGFYIISANDLQGFLNALEQ